MVEKKHLTTGVMANIEQPQFTNALGSGSPPLGRERTNSRDYTQTDEWGESRPIHP